jgi:hypothetical protein
MLTQLVFEAPPLLSTTVTVRKDPAISASVLFEVTSEKMEAYIVPVHRVWFCHVVKRSDPTANLVSDPSITPAHVRSRSRGSKSTHPMIVPSVRQNQSLRTRTVEFAFIVHHWLQSVVKAPNCAQEANYTPTSMQLMLEHYWSGL